MTLNDLLRDRKIDPTSVLVFRHRPMEPQLRKVLPWLAAEKPALFNAYQQTQGARAEQAMVGMSGKGYVASFIGHEAKKALFIGLYKIGKARALKRTAYWNVPEYREMKAFGMRGMSADDPRTSILWFNLAITDFYWQWKGKLIVGWPPPERSWWRRAHTNEVPVLAVREESGLDAEMPDWNQINFTWEELGVLPTRWASRLSEWRAIYLIWDTSDGKGYVGSAYGGDNLLGRWRGYGKTGHGGNRHLRQRDPKTFRFTILERVSPDMSATDVIRLEGLWKERLHTRHPSGLNDN